MAATTKQKRKPARPGDGYASALITSDLLYDEGAAPWVGSAITTEAELEEHYWHLVAADEIEIDFETRQGADGEGVDPYTAEIVGVAIGANGRHRYIPVIAYPTDPTMPWPRVKAFLADLAAMDKTWVAHHGTGFDWIIWKRAGLPWPVRFDDTMVMAWLANPHGKKGQKELEESLLCMKRPTYKEIVENKRDLTTISLEKVAEYAKADSEGMEKLKPILEADLRGKQLEHHYAPSRDQVHIKMWMEERGMPVDADYMRQQRKECEDYLLEQVKIAEVQAQELAKDKSIRCYWGTPDDPQQDALHRAGLDGDSVVDFWHDPPALVLLSKEAKRANSLNLRSTEQMDEFLYERCKLKSDYGRFIKRGINKSMLIRLYKDGVQIAQTMRRLSKAGKMLSGFYVPITESMREGKDGCWRVHTHFNPWRTKTGRWSSSDPINFQNQPNYDKDYPWTAIRRGFIASPGHRLVVGDLSQIELRLVAHISNDPEMRRIYDEDGDIHALTGSRLAKVPFEEFKTWEPPKDLPSHEYSDKHKLYKQYRLRGKPSNFGLTYRMQAPKFQIYCADQYDLFLGLDEIQKMIDAFLKTYAGIPQYWAETQRQIISRGWVETLTGRKAFFSPQLATIAYADNKNDKLYWEAQAEWRKAVNYRIQASAGDLVMAAQRLAYDQWFNSDVWHLSQVHDELIFEAPEAKADKTAAEVHEMLLASQTATFKYQANVEHGISWMDTHA